MNIDVHTTSFVKDKFKSNMHRVGCFEQIKKKVKHTSQFIEHTDLENVYDSVLEIYNDICDEVNNE